jgi:hypothetical protein
LRTICCAAEFKDSAWFRRWRRFRFRRGFNAEVLRQLHRLAVDRQLVVLDVDGRAQLVLLHHGKAAADGFAHHEADHGVGAGIDLARGVGGAGIHATGRDGAPDIADQGNRHPYFKVRHDLFHDRFDVLEVGIHRLREGHAAFIAATLPR